MDYNFTEIEQKWQAHWAGEKTFRAVADSEKPKFYVLDMFPYPSGAGLHVGHPLGYIASDIYSRYMRHRGYNVLHPMGYDAFGLPAEQYAIQTGRHPAETTEENIKRYRGQLDKIGFSYDWDREVRTCDPGYFKWTQWVFLQLFKHYFNKKTDKAEPIDKLIAEFKQNGNQNIQAACNDEAPSFTAAEWKAMDEKQQSDLLMNYRLAYQADTMVNWCPELGTVLANDEVKEGFSVRGGHPVEQKKMTQWLLRVSAYAERLLSGLDTVNWTDSLKEMQRNWIGRSEGAEIRFPVKGSKMEVHIFTTRPDTIYGSTFMVLAPESELVERLTTAEQKAGVEDYIAEAKKRTERERLSEVKKVSGVFTGSYAVHPFTGKDIPIWVSDYVLAGYGTGAIMAVPAHDSRDYAFAKHFGLPIVEVVSGGDISEESYDAKEGKLINSDFINDMNVPEAISTLCKAVEERGIGKAKVNYRLRDAIFSRQRYWGEPFPIYYENGIPKAMNESALPLELPQVDSFLPTAEGEPPLARAKAWKTPEGHPIETSTMPGFAGSSAYYFRYMDPKNDQALVSAEAQSYWKDVDLYIGGTEHATGHLIYSRFWCKFLYDTGHVSVQEPFRKLINQGMIQGRSNLVYRIMNSKKFVSANLRKDYDTTPIHVDVNMVQNDVLDIEAFRQWNPDYKDAEFILEEGRYICGWAIEKMSKSLYNVVNPDDMIAQYGADTLRMYEMFLGPLEQSKPWDTNGIDGVHKFLKRLWRHFHADDGSLKLDDSDATEAELKALHKTIKKISGDIEHFSFNTSVSAFMICLNELGDLKCHKRLVLEPLLVILAPFAPHICEELWNKAGHAESIAYAPWPEWDEKYLVENTHNYPVSFNGKMRYQLELPMDMGKDEIEKTVLAHEKSQKYLEGKQVRKVIIVPKKIVNIVVG